jgi:hypothetical protein
MSRRSPRQRRREYPFVDGRLGGFGSGGSQAIGFAPEQQAFLPDDSVSL